MKEVLTRHNKWRDEWNAVVASAHEAKEESLVDQLLEEYSQLLRFRPDLDGIPNEILKLSRLHPVLLEMCNDVFEQCRVPKLWTQTKLVLLPKPGKDQAVPKGWRGIALMSTVAKLFNRLLLQRLRQRIDSFLLPSQAAYRPGRTTIHNVAALF